MLVTCFEAIENRLLLRGKDSTEKMLTIAFVYFFWCPLLILLSLYRLGCYLLASPEVEMCKEKEEVSSHSPDDQVGYRLLPDAERRELCRQWYQVVREMERTTSSQCDV